jgi:hypothetical protein
LFVNGLLVATAELKNQLTGQSIDAAIGQYRTDRDPNVVALGRRAVVHFAIDTERVAKTRLAGESTQFPPFNLGADGEAGMSARGLPLCARLHEPKVARVTHLARSTSLAFCSIEQRLTAIDERAPRSPSGVG